MTYPCCIHCYHQGDDAPPVHSEPCGGWDCPGSQPEEVKPSE